MKNIEKPNNEKSPDTFHENLELEAIKSGKVRPTDEKESIKMGNKIQFIDSFMFTCK